MIINETAQDRKKIDEEKQKIGTELFDYIKFLAYAGDDGPTYELEEAERHGIRKLKGTPIWTILYPLRKGYRAVRYLHETGASGLYQKAENKVKNSKYIKRKEGRKFLTEIMPTEEEKARQRERKFERNEKISVLVPLYNTPEKFLRDMIESVTAQTYQNWELCLADASDENHASVGSIVSEYAKKDTRIVYQKLEKNGGIADNTNECIKMATGSYLALFDHDDMLHPSALYECAKAIEKQNADFVYTDEITFEGENLEDIVTYHFKPDFSVDNLRGVNYICHLSVFRTSLVEQVGMFSKEYDGSQDHDMILRLTDASKVVVHVPKILYFWRCHQMSTSMNLDAKSYAIEAGRRAVHDAEERRGYPATVYSTQICKTHYRMDYKIGAPKVTVIIDGRKADKESVYHTAASVEKRASYADYEIRIARSEKELKEHLFESNGEYILLLEAGISLITPSFIEELLMFAQRNDVSVTGAQILDEKDMILSSDVVMGHTARNIGIEVNRGGRYDAPGYMGRNYYAHNVTAVSGTACMIKKESAETFAKLIDTYDSIAGETAALCLMKRAEGGQIVVNPYALCCTEKEKFHGDLSETDRNKLFLQFQPQLEKGDPFYNKNLSYEQFWQKK